MPIIYDVSNRRNYKIIKDKRHNKKLTVNCKLDKYVLESFLFPAVVLIGTPLCYDNLDKLPKTTICLCSFLILYLLSIFLQLYCGLDLVRLNSGLRSGYNIRYYSMVENTATQIKITILSANIILLASDIVVRAVMISLSVNACNPCSALICSRTFVRLNCSARLERNKFMRLVRNNAILHKNKIIHYQTSKIVQLAFHQKVLLVPNRLPWALLALQAVVRYRHRQFPASFDFLSSSVK